ncbi:hypothetical protein C8R44DRAFT_754251 [Mycena epipterygia]|nr:hypothetical protein C8R44DRAFT_754251 [Mycena epipterygia]
MPGIAPLNVDLLRDIMLRASSIDEKFALAQVHVSRSGEMWHSTRLSSGPRSQLPPRRIAIMFPSLERSGSTTMLHICVRFSTGATDWLADRLLVPYVACIETPDVWLRVAVDTPLLESNLQLRVLM